jgi:hypothetical protein
MAGCGPSIHRHDVPVDDDDHGLPGQEKINQLALNSTGYPMLVEVGRNLFFCNSITG